ncbi:MAG: DNA polymerase III subunit beta [Lentisphaerota bacterium]
MKIKVPRIAFLSALQKLNSIIGTRTTLQILSHILIQTDENKIILITTDLDIRIRSEVNAEVIEPGETTVPAKKLYEITREMFSDDILLETDTNHHMSINGGNSKFKLLGLSTEGFPIPMPASIIRSFAISQNEFSRMLNLISYSVKTEDDGNRKALTGILISTLDNNATCVATDGKRLALCEKGIDNFSGSDGDAVIPIKSALELKSLLTNKTGILKVEIATNLVNFIIDDVTTMTTKIIEEVYPNYRQVIPPTFSKQIKLNRNTCASVLSRVSLVVTDKSNFVKVTFLDHKLEMSASSTEIGESSDFMDIEYDGAEVSISINPTYLRDPIQRMDSDTISVKMNDGYSPIALSNEDGFLYVVMPMRNR